MTRAANRILTDRAVIDRIVGGDLRPDDRRYGRARGDGATLRALLETSLRDHLTGVTLTGGSTRKPRGVDEPDGAIVVAGSADDVADGLRTLLGAPPVEAFDTLDLRHYDGQFPAVDDPRLVATLRALRTASHGDPDDAHTWSACYFSHRAANALFGSPHVGALRQLHLTGYPVRGTNPHAADRAMIDQGAVLRAIGDSPYLRELRELRLDGFEAMLSKDFVHLRRLALERLVVYGADLTADAVAGLLDGPMRHSLRALEIASPACDDAMCRVIAGFESLEVLRLRRDVTCYVDPLTELPPPIGRPGLAALADAPWYPSMNTLEIEGRDPRAGAQTHD